jgi:hypothetical protein
MAECRAARKSPAGSSGGPEGLFGPACTAVFLLSLRWFVPEARHQRFRTDPAGVSPHCVLQTAWQQSGATEGAALGLRASGVPVWMIDDGAATNFFGRNNSYSLVRFVLAGPGRRWDTAARKPNHSVEWLAVPLFSNALFFLARGSPLGSANKISIFCHQVAPCPTNVQYASANIRGPGWEALHKG